MTYTVKYKLPHQLYWRKLKRVDGDDTMPNGNRCFYLEDKTRIEIPPTAEIIYSPERFYLIKQQMESESGQAIPTK